MSKRPNHKPDQSHWELIVYIDNHGACARANLSEAANSRGISLCKHRTAVDSSEKTVGRNIVLVIHGYYAIGEKLMIYYENISEEIYAWPIAWRDQSNLFTVETVARPLQCRLVTFRAYILSSGRRGVLSLKIEKTFRIHNLKIPW